MLSYYMLRYILRFQRWLSSVDELALFSRYERIFLGRGELVERAGNPARPTITIG
jgi:hypothetical protein